MSQSWQQNRQSDNKIFAKSIKTILAEFNSSTRNKKWLLVFSKQIPAITTDLTINKSKVDYNMQAAAKLGKSNVNLLFVLF